MDAATDRLAVRTAFVLMFLLATCLVLAVAMRGSPASGGAAREHFVESPTSDDDADDKEDADDNADADAEADEDEDEEEGGAAAAARYRARDRLRRELDEKDRGANEGGDDEGDDADGRDGVRTKPMASKMRPLLDERGGGHRYKIIDTEDGRLGKCLLIDGAVQMCDRDEYRYHEMLVHFPCRYLSGGVPKRVMIVGGGDCMALREVLKYDSVIEVLVIESDTRLVSICERHFLVDSYHTDSRVNWVRHGSTPLGAIIKKLQTPENLQRYDFVIVDTKERTHLTGDLRDPDMYREIRLLMKRDSVLVKNVSESGMQHEVGVVERAFPNAMVYSFHSRTHETQYRMVIGSAKKLDKVLDEGGNPRIRGDRKSAPTTPHGRFYRPDRHFSHVPWFTALKQPRPVGGFLNSVVSAAAGQDAPIMN